ncbi:MAG: ATP synthase F1 subunit delta [Vicinamibacteria bacterium]|nr:ATP synthase F1 subunit delta [Vicinamibacteria bacterium]
MNDTQSARRYARAIIETAADPKAVRDELAAVAATLKANPTLREALGNPGVPPATKKSIFFEIFTGLSAPLPRFFEMLIEGGRVELFKDIVQRYHAEWNARNNVHSAKVVTALPLGDEETQSLRKALEAAVSGSVEIEMSVDAALVGGLKVEVDGHLFDGTVTGRLHALRQHLL